MMSTESKRISRRHWTQEEISGFLEKWEVSGLSRYRFAKQNGINSNTFSRWVLKSGIRNNKSISAQKDFVKVTFPEASKIRQPFAELHFGDKRLVFFDEPSSKFLKELLT